MSDHIGLNFKETMAGGFALNSIHPDDGFTKGEQSDSYLAVHLKITLEDLDKFIADKHHSGSIGGNVDFTPFGNNISVDKGSFNCFSPGNDPSEKQMVYELWFKHKGTPYYFRGQKNVKDDPGFDMWKDTTKLYSVLFQGDSDDGDIVGAGILTLGITQLAKLLSSMNVSGTQDNVEKTKAVTTFGRFFMGNLWDTYGEKFSLTRNQTTPHHDNNIDFDAVVIGSGFGGSVTACRLAEKGMSVCILERGRHWKPQDYPRAPDDAWWWSHDEPAKSNGWLDMRLYSDMAVAQGCGVGGGSLIYANVFIEAKPFVFDSDWPAEITYETLKPYYEKTGEMLDVQEIPDNQLTERYKMMKTAAEAAGYGDRFTKVPLAVSFDESFSYDREDPFNEKHSVKFTNAQGLEQGSCIHCGNCDIGCSVSAKNTLDLNYLPLAQKHGAEIRPLHLVRKITPGDTHYRIDFDQIDPDNETLQPGYVNAKKVILAAGTMGTNELLLKCRDEFGTLPDISDKLGHQWSSNGDFLTPAAYPGRDLAPTRGPTISSAIDFLDGSVNGQRFFVEDGGFPDILGNALQDFNGTSQLGLLITGLGEAIRNRNPLSCIMPWFGQGVDASNGRLHLSRSWLPPFNKKMDLDWDIEKSKAAIQALIDMHKELSRVTDGDPSVPPTWELFKNLATPHPLGGCIMGDNKQTAVVNHKGEVFGYPGLYVADGSIIPKAIGLNPSRTIAALAERIAELIE